MIIKMVRNMAQNMMKTLPLNRATSPDFFAIESEECQNKEAGIVMR